MLIRDAEDRIQELLTLNTRLENERRNYKAQTEALRAILHVLLIEQPLLMRLGGQDGPPYSTILQEMTDMIVTIAERNKSLENDAWTQWAPYVRQFVREADECLDRAQDASDYEQFIKAWRDILEKLVA